MSVSDITATRVTVGDHIIINCSWINKKYETNHFLKMFPDRRLSFNGLKHLTEKVIAVASLTRVWVVVDHTMPTPLQRSTKLKISQWYFDQRRSSLDDSILLKYFCQQRCKPDVSKSILGLCWSRETGNCRNVDTQQFSNHQCQSQILVENRDVCPSSGVPFGLLP